MSDPLFFFRHVDLALLAIALPVFLFAGWPIEGWAAGTVAWVAQKLIASYAANKARNAEKPQQVAGIMAGSMIGRGWLAALTIFGVGVGVSDDAGLAAAVLFLAVFTAAFTANLIVRPFDTSQTSL
jgi:hypothetical protein